MISMTKVRDRDKKWQKDFKNLAKIGVIRQVKILELKYIISEIKLIEVLKIELIRRLSFH